MNFAYKDNVLCQIGDATSSKAHQISKGSVERLMDVRLMAAVARESQWDNLQVIWFLSLISLLANAEKYLDLQTL